MERADLAGAVERDALEATLASRADELAAAAHEHGSGGLASVRRAEHAGHEIVVRTTYEITIGGRPFDVHMNVDNAGRVHYHGLPTRDFASVVDLVARVIDQFPGEFGPDAPAEPAGPADGHAPHDHGGHEGHEPGGHEHHGGGG